MLDKMKDMLHTEMHTVRGRETNLPEPVLWLLSLLSVLSIGISVVVIFRVLN